MKNIFKFCTAMLFLGIAILVLPFSSKAAGPPSGIINVLAPADGEVLKAGTSYTIKWTGPVKWIEIPGSIISMEKVKLLLLPLSGQYDGQIVISNSAVNNGSYKWSIPKNLSSGDKWMIQIVDVNGKYYDNSHSFKIVSEATDCKKEGESIPVIANPPSCCSGLTLIKPKAANVMGSAGICTAKCGNKVCDSATETAYNCPADCAKVSINVISPNGGETWKIGEIHNITWKSSGINNVGIELVNASDNLRVCYLNGGNSIPASQSSYNFAVNTCQSSSAGQLVTISPGNYKIRVTSFWPEGGEAGYSDSSDNYFKIIAPTQCKTDADCPPSICATCAPGSSDSNCGTCTPSFKCVSGKCVLVPTPTPIGAKGVNIDLVSATNTITNTRTSSQATGVFTFRVQPYGGTMTMPTYATATAGATNQIAILAYDAQGNVYATGATRTVITNPNSNIPDAGSATITVVEVVTNDGSTGPGLVRFKVVDWGWEVGNTIGQAPQNDSWATPYANLGGVAPAYIDTVNQFISQIVALKQQLAQLPAGDPSAIALQTQSLQLQVQLQQLVQTNSPNNAITIIQVINQIIALKLQLVQLPAGDPNILPLQTQILQLQLQMQSLMQSSPVGQNQNLSNNALTFLPTASWSAIRNFFSSLGGGLKALFGR